jgi:penicillin-binding protein 1A
MLPSLSLGTGLVTPLDMTAAFAAFPNGGFSVRPRGIRRVTDADGVAVFEDAAAGERVISAETAFQMVSMLQDVVTQGTGAAARQWGIPRADRRKDGHHQRFQGRVVRRLLVVDRRRRLGGVRSAQKIGADGYGSKYALPIWGDFMRQALRSRRGASSPCRPRCTTSRLCRISYLRPVEGCPHLHEYFKPAIRCRAACARFHQGSVKQRVRRAVEGFLSGLGKRIGGSSPADSFRCQPPLKRVGSAEASASGARPEGADSFACGPPEWSADCVASALAEGWAG